MCEVKDGFIMFLAGQLIPDLKASGTDATAETFEKAIEYMTLPFDGGAKTSISTTGYNFSKDQEIVMFCEWLTDILIPDLRESGYEATPDDLEECVKLIKEHRSRLLFVTYWNDYLTLECFALDFQMDQADAAILLRDGKELHDREARLQKA